MNLSQAGNVTIDIISISGKVVKQFTPGYLSKGENTAVLELNELDEGVYLIHIKNGNWQRTTRFIKH